MDIISYALAKKMSGNGGGGSADGIKYSEQNLTTEQQTQVRKNLGLYGSEIAGTSGVGIDVTWDGNIEGLDKIEIYNAEHDYTATYYKVSDIVPDLSDISNYYTQSDNDGTAVISSTEIEDGDTYPGNTAITLDRVYSNNVSNGILGISYWGPYDSSAGLQALEECTTLLVDDSNQEYDAGIYFGRSGSPDGQFTHFDSALHLANAPWSNVAENIYNPIDSKFTSAISYTEEQELTNEQKMRARINQGLYAESIMTQPYSISITADSIEYMNESLGWSTDSNAAHVYKLSDNVPFNPEEYLGKIISIDIISEGVDVTQTSNAPYFSIGGMLLAGTSAYMLDPSASSESRLGDILFITQNDTSFQDADWEKGVYFIQFGSNQVPLPTLLNEQGSFDASFNGITITTNSILNPVESKFTQAISYSETQSLTTEQQMKARHNQGLYGSITEKVSEVEYVVENDLSSFPSVSNSNNTSYWYRIGDVPTNDLTKIYGISKWSNAYGTYQPDVNTTYVFHQENANGFNNKRLSNNNDVQILVVPVSTTVTISSYGTFNFTNGVWINSAYSHDARQPADKITSFTLSGDFSTTTITKIPSQYLEYPPLLIGVESHYDSGTADDMRTYTIYDKTFDEVYTAYFAGRRVVLLDHPSSIIVNIAEPDSMIKTITFAEPFIDYNDDNPTLSWNPISLIPNEEEKLTDNPSGTITIPADPTPGGNISV